MAAKVMGMVLLMVMMMVGMGGCYGRELAANDGSTSSTSSPASCSPGVVLQQLRACGRYVAPNGPSSGESPSDECCNALQSVDVGCLCQLLNNGPPVTYLDKTKALALPQACNMNTTPSNCPNNGN